MAKVESILLYVMVIYLISFISGILQQSIMTRISQRTVYTLRREFKNKMKKNCQFHIMIAIVMGIS